MQGSFHLTDDQWSIINGSLLGDGYITKPLYGKSAFTKNQCGRHRQYLEWHFEALKPYSCSLRDCHNSCNGKSYERSTFRTSNSFAWAELRTKWYPEGKKTIPADLLLTPLSIAVWFFDDGSNTVKKRQAKFATYCFTREECELLQYLLEKHDISTTITARNVMIVKTDSYKTLVDLIKPYMLWPCFEHKVRYRDAEFSAISDEEKRVIFEMQAQGMLHKDIAAAIGKSRSPVSTILRQVSPTPGVSSRNKSGVPGVCWDNERNKWIATCRQNGKNIRLGRYETLEEATKAVEVKKQITLSYIKHATTNFPRDDGSPPPH